MEIFSLIGRFIIYSNESTSKYDELIGAVGTYFNSSGIAYSFDVYVNGDYKATVAASAGAFTGTNCLSTNLAASDTVDAIAYAPGKAKKAATQVTVAS